MSCLNSKLIVYSQHGLDFCNRSYLIASNEAARKPKCNNNWYTL